MDKDALINYGGPILPIGGIIFFLTFSLTPDDIIRTSLLKEIRLTLHSHKALIYQGGYF